MTIDPPLRGEWRALSTPGHRVPTHYTYALGLTYAYDFVRCMWHENRPGSTHRGSRAAYFMGRVATRDCYAWAQPIFAPFGGVVAVVSDALPDRRRLAPIRDAWSLLRGMTASARRGDLSVLFGNHVVLEGPCACALFAHVRHGSAQLRNGDEVHVGDRIAEVGHSGSSLGPHLHFQLMDRVDIRDAKGVPCRFRSYERFDAGAWIRMENAIPGKNDRIRFLAAGEE